MTRDNESSPEVLDVRRKKLKFHCWHRGTREMDLVLGRFADDRLATMTTEDVSALELLLEAPDSELFAWITGGKTAPANFDLPILREIRNFHLENPVSGAS